MWTIITKDEFKSLLLVDPTLLSHYSVEYSHYEDREFFSVRITGTGDWAERYMAQQRRIYKNCKCLLIENIYIETLVGCSHPYFTMTLRILDKS